MARARTHLGLSGRLQLRLGGLAGWRAPSAHDVAEHEGRTPQPGVPPGPRNTHRGRGPGSESAGYHSDMTIPGYQPKTPTVAPSPGQAPVTPAGLYPGATHDYHQAVAALPPSVQLAIAPAAPPMPLTATQRAASQAGSALAALLTPGGALRAALGAPASSPGPSTPTPPHPNPNQNPATATISSRPGHHPNADPLGPKTPGNATVAELVAAAQKRELRVSARGKLTTPAERDALRQLHEARQAVATSGPNLTALHQQYPELSLRTLRAYRAANRATGVPPQLLAGIEGQESNYGQSTLPGVHSGQNFAGAAGPFQIGNGTGASGDWWGEHMPPSANIYNERTAAIGAGKYLTEAGATKDPSTWYNAALAYNHADWYAQKAVELAQQHGALGRLGRPNDPQAAKQLQVAESRARQLGLPLRSPEQMATVPGKGRFVFPFPENKGWVWSRTDMGTDFAYTHEGAPIRALGSGEIVEPIPGEQHWEGGNGLLLKLDHAKGLPSQYVFLYEGIKQTVPYGTKVKAGQTIAVGAITGSIETGFANAEGVPLAASVYSEGDETAAGKAMTNLLHSVEEGKKRIPVGLLQVDGHLSPSAGGVAYSSSGQPGAVVAPSGGSSAPVMASPLTSLASPLAAGPVMPSDLLSQGQEEAHGESAAQNLLALLGGEELRRPSLSGLL